ncbi:MAG TPA: ABC transporter permease [Gaiellaceae bacterium]|nr:ABC transporter permease [Gaiellaceae bacterium]
MRNAARAASTAAIRLAAVGVGLVASALVLASIGQSPWEALRTLLEGAFGNEFALGQTLLKSIPLALTGLAVALCLRMRLWNIGAEGQLHAGAIGASAAALAFTGWPAGALLPAMIGASMLAGALWASLAAVPRALWGVNEIITTLLLNYVAILAVAWLVTGPWRGEGNFPVSDPFPPGSRLPLLGWNVVHLGVIFPVVLATILAFVLARSRLGFEVRTIGASPAAARVAGMSTARNVLVVMLTAGAIAGIAGMVEVSMSFGRLRQGISPGYGFMAIVIAALAGASFFGTLVVAFLFAGFIVGGFALQTLGVPASFVLLIQGFVLFAALVGSYVSDRRLLPFRSPRAGAEGPTAKEEPSTL